MSQPKPGQWWYQIYDHKPYGSYDTREQAVKAGINAAKQHGCVHVWVGQWIMRIVAGANDERIEVE